MRAILFVLLFPALCLASGMKPLDGYNNLYYEETRRAGDLVSVTLFQNNNDSPIDSMTLYATVDCKTGIATVRDSAPLSAKPQTALAKSLCKRSWEIWK